MDQVPSRLLIELVWLFFMINSIVLLNVFYNVNLEIWPFTSILNYTFHLFLPKAVVAMHQLLFYTFFEATWLMSHTSSCLNLLRFPLSKWLKSCLFLLTERRSPNCILSQTVVILDGRSVSTFDACAIEKTFYRILRLNFVKVNDFNEQ